MELATGLDFVRVHRQGTLVTIGRQGRPQISNILYAVDEAGTARISVTDDRQKIKNLRRDPRASLYVVGEDFWHWVVLEGTVELSAVVSRPEDPAADELVELYRAAAGREHPDWAEYRRALVAERRLVVRLRAERAYGLLAG